MPHWFNDLVSPFQVFLLTNQRTYWLYLLVAMVMAIMAFMARASTLSAHGKSKRFWSAFLHRSALVDYRFFFVGRLLFFLVIAPILLSSNVVSDFLLERLTAIATPLAWFPPIAVLFSILMTLGFVVVFDLSIFIVHFFFHRIPALWEFHKVHHSAEVLNPLTIYRIHPFEEIVTATSTAVLTGIFQAVFLFVLDPSVQIISVGHLNLFLFLFYFFGFNLRHSPAPISYKPFLERILISPAQHHIHHSSNLEHYDKNLGFMLAIWDRVFGSLILSSPNQQITYGLGGEEREYSSVNRLFFLPIVKNVRRLLDWLRT
jgi:sterol desaturase/sphingolipid hydroxylase (fatty acid hydroxylase superfamily)